MKFKASVLLAAMVSLSACSNMPVNVGDESAKTAATGAAGGANSTNANKQLEHCDKPFGTIAIVEDQQAPWYSYLTRDYRLTSTTPVLSMLIQQSNCFIVVNRGRAMQNMMQERELQQSGEMRGGSNFGKGQMVSADYTLSPEIIFAQNDTGGAGGALAGFGGAVGLLGAIAGSIKSNEASTILTLTDNRSGVQVGAAEGSGKNYDWGLGGLLAGGGAGGALGGYTKTPQGKVIVGAFINSYNQLIEAMRTYQPQTMGDRGMGTGGRLAVDGASQQQGYKGRKVSLKQAQEILLQKGYDIGTPDGKMGAKTRDALSQYQSEQGLRVTGRLDDATAADMAK